MRVADPLHAYSPLSPGKPTRLQRSSARLQQTQSSNAPAKSLAMRAGEQREIFALSAALATAPATFAGGRLDSGPRPAGPASPDPGLLAPSHLPDRGNGAARQSGHPASPARSFPPERDSHSRF